MQDSQGQPVATAAVDVWIYPKPKDWEKNDQQFTADDSGKIAIGFEPEMPMRTVCVECKTPGYAPVHLVWTYPRETAPEEYIIKLDKGGRIGGVVIDEQGNPIPEVEVAFLMPFAHRVYPLDKQARSWVKTKTDAVGAWCCNYFPPELKDINLYMTCKSPDFKELRKNLPLSQVVADSQGHFSQTITLEKGCVFSGRVVDESGKPIANAKVSGTETQHDTTDFTVKTTNEKGEFQFQNLAATQDGILIVTAPGFLTESITPFAISEKMQPIELVLKAAKHPLKIKTVDENGKPIPEVRLFVQEWKGLRQYYTPSLLDEKHRKTDADGMVVWNEAPVEELGISLLTEDNKHYNLRSTLVQARPEEYVFTLRTARNIPIKVYDSQTKEPIPLFTITYGSVYSPELAKKYNQDRTYMWASHLTRDGINGSYTYTESEKRMPLALKAEAVGYRPIISRTIGQDENDVALEFPMEKLPKDFAGTLAGTVMTPTDEPVENATVVVSTGDTVPVTNGMFNPEIFATNSNLNKTTDSQGRFEFPMISNDDDLAVNLNLPPEQRKKIEEISVPDCTIFVFHEQGFAELTQEEFEKSETLIKLQPWAKVEGTLLLGSAPGKNQPIRLQMEPKEKKIIRTRQSDIVRKPEAYYRYDTTTDENGKFRFDRVPSGQWIAARTVRYSDILGRYSDIDTVQTEPGKTATMQLGGVGRPVIGKLEVPGDFGLTPIWRNGIVLLISDLGEERNEERIIENQKTIRASAIDRGGNFRIENVPPGQWKLDVSLVRNTPTHYDQSIGEARMSFTVEEMPNKQSDEPFDIGTLTVKRVFTEEEKWIKVGAAAPDFMLKRLVISKDGENGNEKEEIVKLSELRGKTVVLEFWATWCGPCIKKIPEITAFYEKIKDNPNIVLIGISLDDEDETAVEFLQKRNMPWIQLRTDWPSPLTESLGFSGIPAMFVVNPEGQISMIDPTPEEMETLLDTR